MSTLGMQNGIIFERNTCHDCPVVVLAVVKATVVEVVDAAVSTYTENRSKG